VFSFQCAAMKGGKWEGGAAKRRSRLVTCDELGLGGVSGFHLN